MGKAQNVAGQSAGKNRVTVWSNNMNCPLISASVESTSMLDPALKRAAVDYLKVGADRAQGQGQDKPEAEGRGGDALGDPFATLQSWRLR